MSSSADERLDVASLGLLRQARSVTALTDWKLTRTAPSAIPQPAALDGVGGWLAAQVPGTAACALRDAGLLRPGERYDFDAEDWWLATTFAADAVGEGETVRLCFGGIATLAEVYLNGELLFESDSMFAAHAVDVGAALQPQNELCVCCRALAPALAARRRPRARWRARIADGGLRFHRTMLLGRAPGFAPGPATVGLWRPVLLARSRAGDVEAVRVRARLEGDRGVVTVSARIQGGALPVDAGEIELVHGSRSHCSPLELASTDGAAELRGVVEIAQPQLWWPHTHGDPALYQVRLRLERGHGGDRDAHVIDAGRVGFRALRVGAHDGHELERDGLDLRVNETRCFARGALWTPLDIVGMAPSRDALRASLEQVRACGMNMLRIPGTSCYETDDFYDLCDELGILVWQDFMFANFDYPFVEDAFRDSVEAEAAEILGRLAHRPSVAVLCGNSEIEQQVAMLGLDPALGRGEPFGELLPGFVERSGIDAVYVPSAPCGGALPFRADAGVANYYGVGGYRRPLADARRAEVKFAAECLAFANVPEAPVLEALAPDAAAPPPVHDPRWKAGVPRDSGVGWDFDDVRDHYLASLYQLDPGELRRVEVERYLELSRLVTGEAMSDVIGEWRRERSPCRGALVLWLKDLLPGAGWGILDSAGQPKAAYHHLRRALAPVAVWVTDEGLAGLHAHVANDRPLPLVARLRLATYGDGQRQAAAAQREIELAPHSLFELDLEQLLGRFVDISWAYRFGPCEQDTVVVSLESDSQELLSQAFFFPAGRPLAQRTAAELGLQASFRVQADRSQLLALASSRLVYGLRVRVPGFEPEDDAFCLEPGRERVVRLRSLGRDDATPPASARLAAANLRGQVSINAPDPDATANA